jgi:hypothetical protein
MHAPCSLTAGRRLEKDSFCCCERTAAGDQLPREREIGLADRERDARLDAEPESAELLAAPAEDSIGLSRFGCPIDGLDVRGVDGMHGT